MKKAKDDAVPVDFDDDGPDPDAGPSGHNAPPILPLDGDEPFNPSPIPENEEGKKRQLAKQFQGAKKAQCQSWIENDVCDLVGMKETR